MGRHHYMYRWSTANFDLCLALMAIEQWGFFSVPHLLWHRTSVYNGHFRGPLTLTPIAEGLATVLSLTVLTTKVCRNWDSNTQHSACGANALTNCARHRHGLSLLSVTNLGKNCNWNPLVIVNHHIFVDEWKTEIYWSICGPLHRILWPLIWWKILINNKYFSSYLLFSEIWIWLYS